MNDDLMSRLDDRGRSAGAAAHGAVAELPIPDFDPDLVRVSLDDDPTTGAAGRGGRGDRRWLAVVGIAAALLVVALGAALVSRAGDDDSAPTDNVGTTDQVRPYVAGWVPEDFQVSHVSDGGGAAAGDMSFRLVVFGPSTDDPRLGIVSLRGSTSIEDQIAEGDESYRSVGTVEGREVFMRDEQQASFAFDEGGQQVVIIPAEGVSESTVLEVVGALELDGDEVGLADPPEDWERLGVIGDPFFLAARMGGAATHAHYAAYSGPIEEVPDGVSVPTALISSTSGTALDVSAVRLFAPHVEEITVRARPGAVLELDDDADGSPDGWLATWEERPGEVVRVMGSGMSKEDVLAIAEDVRPATSSEWDDLSRAAVLTPRPGEELVGTGAFSDGSTWALVVEEGDGGERWTSLRTTIADDGSTGSGQVWEVDEDGERVESELPALADVTRSSGGGLAWACGLLDPTSGAAVARVVVEDAAGAVVAEAVLVGEGALRGWVVELPPGLVPPGDEGTSGSGSSGSSSGSGSSASGGSEGPTTTSMEGGVETTYMDGGDGGDVDEEVDGPTVVAYAADGTELARQPLP